MQGEGRSPAPAPSGPACRPHRLLPGSPAAEPPTVLPLLAVVFPQSCPNPHHVSGWKGLYFLGPVCYFSDWGTFP